MLNEIREKLKEKQQAANKPFVHIRDAEEILEYQEKIFYMALEEILNQSNHSIPVHAFGDNEAACVMNDALNNIQQIAWGLLNSCNDDSNRLDGVVIQKPAGIEDDLRERISQILIAQPTDCRNETNILADRIIEEEIKPLMIHENGEGYAEGIGQTLEATKRTEKMLLNECCEALGWQGGTIHQVKNAIIDLQKYNNKSGKACIGCEYNVAEHDIWYADKCPDCARSERKDLYELRKRSIEQMHEDLKKKFEEK